MDCVIGCYTNGKQGVIYRLSVQKGQLLPYCQATDASFLISTDSLVYFVEQIPQGTLNVVKNGQIVYSTSTCGSGPCHIALNAAINVIAVTNYNSGSLILYKLNKFDYPSKIISLATFYGFGSNLERQKSSHPHSSLFLPQSNSCIVADLGTDKIYWFEIEEDKAERIQEREIFCLGAGPRSMCLGSKSHKLVYVSGQLLNQILILTYENNRLQLLKGIMFPNNPKKYPSDLVYLSPSIYMGIRGDASLLVMDEVAQKKSLKNFRKIAGVEWPRQILKINQKTIGVCCQRSGQVRFMRLEGDSMFIDKIGGIPHPACLALLPK